MATVKAGGQPPRAAVVVRVRLPATLERLRRHSVGVASSGVPAHVTLLYPFVAPSALDRTVRARLRSVVERHPPFAYRLVGRGRWPDLVYVAVEPAQRFVELQADLAAAFPEFPIYGEEAGFLFVPHVTVAEGAAIDDPKVIADPAWAPLPTRAEATALDVLAEDENGLWRTRWRIRLGPAAPR